MMPNLAPHVLLGLWGFLGLEIAVVETSLTFESALPGSPLSGLTLYSTAVTSFLGPQPDRTSNESMRSGPVVLFNNNMCKSVLLRAPSTIILVTTETSSDYTCSFESIYLNLYATGAAAVIWPMVDNVPSVNLYASDGTRGSTTRMLPMLFLQIGPSYDIFDILRTHAAGQNVTVFPDENVWQTTFASWYYQLFVRILPSVVLIVSGGVAVVFLASHVRRITDKYMDVVPVGQRSFSRWATFVRSSANLPHAVLLIETTTATLSGVALAIGGHFSTPNLPYPAVMYFLSLLGGWSLASSLLSASVWIRQVAGLIDSEMILTRILRGDYPIAFILLVFVPVAADTAISAIWATYMYAEVIATVEGAMLFLLQMTVSVHVLVVVLRYYWFARDVQSRTTGVTGRKPGMDALLARLSRCALGMSLSMIMVCIGTALPALQPVRFLYTPAGWTLSFSLAFNGRALDSAFRVAMFKPRPAIRPTAISKHAAVV